ncbi:hypothetical protein TL16_g12728 [Triparma laevis f. inornata]|uniref:Uncharacterized protein n=1 Tax=Triparma laevis f. inornata TaxID=1714386 RepID=A0A9W7BNR9_9STRA|nr:hypothetical protein TL16_g12728 [Triparma laevis f. inornata]
MSRRPLSSSADADDYLEQAKKLRAEAASLESSRPDPSPVSPSSLSPLSYTTISSSKWDVQFTLNLDSTLYTSSSTEITFLSDGYTSHSPGVFSKVWGWDLEFDVGTSDLTGLKDSETMDILLFSADVSESAKLPSSFENQRIYLTAEIAQDKTTKTLRFNKGTLTVKSDDVSGGGLFGLFGNTNGILAQFKVVGRFTMQPTQPK